MTKLITKIHQTDLRERQWQYIKTVSDIKERKRKFDLRVIWNAIFYVVKTGCQWRVLFK
ncbi:transposase [Bacteroides ihuae]|uniref:transposase n=1 Tax=Bacteroides ihuae TaxID=1852362 RepID=UPI001114B63B|nr:transposase [Bacteroides ihuae]